MDCSNKVGRLDPKQEQTPPEIGEGSPTTADCGKQSCGAQKENWKTNQRRKRGAAADASAPVEGAKMPQPKKRKNRKPTPRSVAYNNARLQEEESPRSKPEEKRKEGKEPKGGRGGARTRAVQASQKRGFQEALGARDAKREAETISPEEKRVQYIRKQISLWSNAYERNLGHLLLEHEGRSFFTRSRPLMLLVARLKQLEVRLTYNDCDPEICLGEYPRRMHPSFVLLPTAYPVAGSTFFYDQHFTQDQYEMARGERIRSYVDPDQSWFRTDDTTASPADQNLIQAARFVYRSLSWSQAAKALQEPQIQRSSIVDVYLQSFVRLSKPYGEMSLAAMIQAAQSHDQCPSYFAHQSQLVSDSLTYIYQENCRLWEERVLTCPRDQQFDEKFIDSLSGLNKFGVSVSFRRLTQLYALHLEPSLRHVKESIVAMTKDWKRPSDDESDDDSSGDSPNTVFPDDWDSGDEDEYGWMPPMDFDVVLEVIPGCDNGESSGVNFGELLNERDLNTPETDGFIKPIPPNIAAFLTDNFEGSEDGPEQKEEEVYPETTGKECEEEPSQEFEGSEMHLVGPLSAPILSSGGLGFCLDFSRALTCSVLEQVVPVIPPLSLFMFQHLIKVDPNCAFCFQECSARGDSAQALRCYQSTNIFDQRLKRVALLPAENGGNDGNSESQQAGFWGDHVSVQWQEFDAAGVPFDEAILNLVGDEKAFDAHRLSFTYDGSNFRSGKWSEIHHTLYWHRQFCTDQQVVGLVALRRFGRPIPGVDELVAKRFHKLVALLKVPEKRCHGVEDIMTADDYMPYLEGMPTTSRNKHLDFLNKMTTWVDKEFSRNDSAFVKFDEVLISPKFRIIVNPPPDLFYRLVVGLTEVKQSFKARVFHEFYSDDLLDVYFTYGADLTASQKGKWRKRVDDFINGDKMTLCLMVGGDDNVAIFGCKGESFGLESDVTACDQSHNSVLIEAFLGYLGRMGCPREWRRLLKESYSRPVYIDSNKMMIHFLKPQLHTGHPQTSLANTCVVGQVAAFSFIDAYHNCFVDGLPKSALLQEKFAQNTEGLGMIWKINWVATPYLTFHKGFWVPSGKGFQWLPLPSCLWKTFKIRTDGKLTQRHILERVAFNCYQRVISPNTSVVRAMCFNHFHHIMDLLQLSADEAGFHKLVSLNDKYVNRVETKKQHQLTEEEPIESLEGDPCEGWNLDLELQFFTERYGCVPEDFLYRWDGQPGQVSSAFLKRAVRRDFEFDSQQAFNASCGL